MKVRINWNGGRNGWHSFIVGAGVIPHHDHNHRRLDTTFHAYLGLWVLTIESPANRKKGKR